MLIINFMDNKTSKNLSTLESYLQAHACLFVNLPTFNPGIVIYQHSDLYLNQFKIDFPGIDYEVLNTPYLLTGKRSANNHDTVMILRHDKKFDYSNASITIAGPCSIASEGHIYQNSCCIAQCGIQFLRGGAFKPRTSPYSFQGIGKQALKWLSNAAINSHMYCVSEIVDIRDLPILADLTYALENTISFYKMLFSLRIKRLCFKQKKLSYNKHNLFKHLKNMKLVFKGERNRHLCQICRLSGEIS